MGGIATTAMGFFKKATKGDEVYQKNLVTKTSPADVIMWSGSKDDQTSYVVFFLTPDLFTARQILSEFPANSKLFIDKTRRSPAKPQVPCHGPLSPR
jgi:hypothetical protein